MHPCDEFNAKVDDGTFHQTMLCDDWTERTDSVERIIRCRDCKYYLPTSVETFYCDYWTLNDLHDNNGFCSLAEPKEEA